MKRLFDIFFALFGLIIFWPAVVIIAILVLIKMGGPVFFRQIRAGLHGKPFQIIKFSTMTHAEDKAGKLLPDDMRLTSFGRFLRGTSLDELPELWNVLRGDMCFVGPRPLLMQYLPRYSLEQSRRHNVKPGMTGWAQVNGRNAVSWEKKFAYDVWYVDHMSLWLDLKILFLTLWKTFKREDINEPGEATAREFMGTRM